MQTTYFVKKSSKVLWQKKRITKTNDNRKPINSKLVLFIHFFPRLELQLEFLCKKNYNKRGKYKNKRFQNAKTQRPFSVSSNSSSSNPATSHNNELDVNTNSNYLYLVVLTLKQILKLVEQTTAYFCFIFMLQRFLVF